MILGCLILYFFVAVYGTAAIALLFMPKNTTDFYTVSSFWRVLSPSFIHFDSVHLLGNLTVWWFLARKVEEHSIWHMLALLVLASVIGNLLQWLIVGSKFGGLSGAICALFSYRVVASYCFSVRKFELERSFVVCFVLYILVTSTDLLGKYAIWAHVGGLVTGAVFALFSYKENTKCSDDFYT